MGIIYKVTNKKNGKYYIGQSINDLQYRKRKHYSNAEYLSGKTIFAKALLKYNDFKWEVLEDELDKDQLNIKEEEYIRKFNSHYLDGYGYNMNYGGQGNIPKPSSESLSNGQNRRYKNDSERKKTGMYMKKVWKNMSEETKRKRSKKISEKNGKEYLIITPNNIKIKILSLSKFCRENGLTQANLWKVVKGKREHHKGYKAYEI